MRKTTKCVPNDVTSDFGEEFVNYFFAFLLYISDSFQREHQTGADVVSQGWRAPKFYACQENPGNAFIKLTTPVHRS